MGRVSQIIEFINSQTLPVGMEWETNYTHISKTEELMKFRKEYRKLTKKKDDELDLS